MARADRPSRGPRSQAGAYDQRSSIAGINRLLDAGLISSTDAVTVNGRRAFADFAACADTSRELPRLHFQRVPERKHAKNRVHFDLQFRGDEARRDAVVARMVELGAHKIGEGAQGPAHSWVMGPESHVLFGLVEELARSR